MKHNLPEPYTAEWFRMPVAYVRRVAEALAAGGVEVLDWWDDPCDPRDATLRLAGDATLLWDEESGWRVGAFVSGEQGVRTVLDGVRYLGGGVLPRPEIVARLLAEVRAGGGTAMRPLYRSYRHFNDGFDSGLLGYARLVTA
ncbi:DUF6292 family protein [Streptosporangium soli]|nr:DUF6292 family protein [Streptosporangium sp. KLBMP 9127]